MHWECYIIWLMIIYCLLITRMGGSYYEHLDNVNISHFSLLFIKYNNL